MIVRRLSPSGLGLGRPFGDLEQVRRDMYRFLDALSRSPAEWQSAGVFPLINATQDRNNYYVRAELPGVVAEDLEISAVNRTLTLAGKRSSPPEEGVSYHRKERMDGAFSRSITLPTEFENDKVEASLVNGLLTVTLPKPEKAKPRQISVKVS